MMIFDKQLKNLFNKLVGKDFRNSLIKEHEADLNIAAASLTDTDKPAFPLILTSKEAYKRKNKEYLEQLFDREKANYKYNDGLIDGFKITSYVIGGFMCLVFFGAFLVSDKTILDRIMTFIPIIAATSILPGATYGLSLFLTYKLYAKNIARLKSKSKEYIANASNNLRQNKKAIMIMDESICLIDLTDHRYNTLAVPLREITNLVVTLENKNVEQISHRTEAGLVVKNLTPKKVPEGELQKLHIITSYATYGFTAPCGPNGEDAYQIVEQILNKKAICDKKVIANQSVDYLKIAQAKLDAYNKYATSNVSLASENLKEEMNANIR